MSEKEEKGEGTSRYCASAGKKREGVGRFAVGDTVVIRGLKQQSMYNGSRGLIVGFVAAKERYCVSLEGNDEDVRKLHVRSKNLLTLEDERALKSKISERLASSHHRAKAKRVAADASEAAWTAVFQTEITFAQLNIQVNRLTSKDCGMRSKRAAREAALQAFRVAAIATATARTISLRRCSTSKTSRRHRRGRQKKYTTLRPHIRFECSSDTTDELAIGVHETAEFHHCAANEAAREHRETLAEMRRKHTDMCAKARGACHSRSKMRKSAKHSKKTIGVSSGHHSEKKRKEAERRRKRLRRQRELERQRNSKASQEAAELLAEMRNAAIQRAILVCTQSASFAIAVASDAEDALRATMLRIRRRAVAAAFDAATVARSAASRVAMSVASLRASYFASAASSSALQTSLLCSGRIADVLEQRRHAMSPSAIDMDESEMRILEAARRSRETRADASINNIRAISAETPRVNDDALFLSRLLEAQRGLLDAQWQQAQFLENAIRQLDARANLRDVARSHMEPWRDASRAAFDFGRRAEQSLCHMMQAISTSAPRPPPRPFVATDTSVSADSSTIKPNIDPSEKAGSRKREVSVRTKDAKSSRRSRSKTKGRNRRKGVAGRGKQANGSKATDSSVKKNADKQKKRPRNNARRKKVGSRQKKPAGGAP